ncbi:ABC transporter substrate-binding protein [Streptomyces sp. NPDC004542]|uniref:ABC transporter substrate-binding protein n=1 Tax=Streptomyces sp. NPDC004542 TaxID=3154281 RepID=UPI0033AA1EBB
MGIPDQELSFACAPYDRITPLFLGEAAIEGYRVRPVPMRRPTEIFKGMVEDSAFDVAEMSLSQCFENATLADPPFRAVPVFPSRAFRHGFVFVNRRAGIRRPADLAGRRIGVQHYGMSAAVWIRSALRSGYGVDFSGVTWVEGAVNALGADVKVAGGPPPGGVRVEAVVDSTLSDLLARGEIDAVIGAWVPDSFRWSDDVVRLFPDHRGEERRYFRRTGIFPIMHALAIRSSLVEQRPDLPRLVFDACLHARDIALQQHRSTGALSTMLPWLHDDLDEIDAVFGPDFWSYGLKNNRTVLRHFAEALVAEGALAAVPPLEEVFLPLD